MNFHKMQPRESLNKAFLKVKPNRNDIENFKKNLHSLIEKINESESEEFHKNLIGDFLKNTYYGANHFINTKGRNDFVIHNGKDAKSKVGVILEAKKPTNKSEMLKADNLNTKALQELVLYFLRERLTEKNLEIKYLIATNIYEWFIFDANSFEKALVENKTLVQQFTDFEEGRLSNKKTDFFYKEIAKPAIDEIADKITFINSLKICDPAVGSGHFLVSALNEIITIKSELKILLDREGKRLKEYDIEVVNDELIILDEDGLLFEYNPKSKESQRVQETLFHEKQTIIEGCLFGVDINPNSVKICRLRLWIELLKNAYYRTSPLTPLLGGEGNKEEKMQELETLPNIDINIKCGNSLISRFSLDTDLRVALNRSKCTIESYRNAVQTYRNAENKEQKREMERFINDIKGNLKTILGSSDPNKTKLRKLEGEVENLETQTSLFEETKAEKKAREKKIAKLNNEIDKLRIEIEDIVSGKIYENAFEWRFEFPEVLNNDGVFVGFDVVIGNPPYVPSKNLNEREKALYYEQYQTTEYQINTFGIFSELGIKILKLKGKLGLIIPNYWLATKYDKKLREFLFKENQTTDIINIYSVFESAVVETLLLFVNKQKNNKEINIRSIDSNISTIEKRLDAVMFSNWIYDKRILISSLNTELTLSFEDTIKINAESLIGNLFDLKFGAKLYEVGKGNPPQSKNDAKNKIYESELKIEESYILLLRARNIQKYLLKIDNYYVKYGENLAAPRSIKIFEGERILIQRIVSKSTLDATYIEETMICNTDVITLKPKNDTINVKFYLAIICSKLCASVLKSQNVNLDRNAFPKINTETLSTFPVPEYKSEYINIVSIVDKILTAKKSDPNADTTALETEIDQLVYQLYELTAEEIKIIEG